MPRVHQQCACIDRLGSRSIQRDPVGGCSLVVWILINISLTVDLQVLQSNTTITAITSDSLVLVTAPRYLWARGNMYNASAGPCCHRAVWWD